MLPTIRSEEYLYAVPKFDLDKDDVKDFMNELSGFHEQSPIVSNAASPENTF